VTKRKSAAITTSISRSSVRPRAPRRAYLVAVAAAAPQADQDAAKAKAEKLLQQAKQNPSGFAELAKANSKIGFRCERGDLVSSVAA